MPHSLGSWYEYGFVQRRSSSDGWERRGAAGNVAGIVDTMKIAPEGMQGRVGSIATLMASGANAVGALAAGGILGRCPSGPP